MESLEKDKILLYNYNTLEEVRTPFGLNKKEVIEDAVTILEDWVKEQHHFTKKKFDRRYLEMMIISSKGSIQRAKVRLDRACTFRTMKPELFQVYDLRELFNTDLIHVVHAVLPRMTKDNERVYICRNEGKKFEPTVIKSYVRTVPSISEYVRIHDYAAGYILILDYQDTNLADFITKVTISDLQELVAFLLDCCGFRLKACYVVSTSKIIELGMAMMKQVASAKICERIHVLKTREEAGHFIDKDVLPKEYGGNETPLEKLHEQWLEVLTSEEHLEYLNDINSARTDESLRQRADFNEHYMGMPGTFRMLSVD